ncbi:hypothetical protein AB0J86_13670 [Micromonospora sp. NPDC049559]|uniref:hypothetical protein n=1 Tax=Micromonospora sp. NPDC049559 TaxID=3155923 RepID=UPI003445AB92
MSRNGDGAMGLDSEERERIEARAEHLLPEERSAGSDDPRAQAEAILAESDTREYVPDAAPDTHLERRTADETVPPEPSADPRPLEPPD